MKYKLTEETIEHKHHILYRIEALKNFGYIKKGDKGGFIESEDNLSQDSNSWIGGNAKVFGNAKVYNNAVVFDNAEIYGDAKVYGNAMVFDNAKVYGCAKISSNAKVLGDTMVFDNAEIEGNASIYGNAKVYGNARVLRRAIIKENAKVYGNAWVYDNTWVFGNAEVCGDSNIGDNADIGGDSKVESMYDYIVFKNWWSSGRHFTWTRSNNKWKVGCFYGTGDELVAKAYKDSELSGREYKRLVDYVESILQDEKGGEK